MREEYEMEDDDILEMMASLYESEMEEEEIESILQQYEQEMYSSSKM